MSWNSEEVLFKGKLNKKRKRKFTSNPDVQEKEIEEASNQKKEKPTKDIEPKKQVKFDQNISIEEKKKEKLREKRSKQVDEISKDLKSNNKSKRQLKREKNEARLSALKTEKDKVLLTEVLNYLSKWKHNRETWKFEKKKNFYIFHNILDEDKIPDEIWNTVLEYVNNSMGKIKEKTIQEATKIIEDMEKEDDENASEKVSDKKYERARTFIQYIN